MALTSRSLREGWVLITLALLLCPVTSFKRLQSAQSDEDLTFDDDENPFLLSRSRRDAGTIGSGFGGDDEDFEEESSGHYSDRLDTVYRIKYSRDNKYILNMYDKPNLEEKIKSILKDVTGDVYVRVIGTASVGSDRNEITMDITHIGPNNNDQFIELLLERYIDSATDTIPRSLIFRKVTDKDRSGDCAENEELCSDGTCVPKCDGHIDCTSGADELNCSTEPPATEIEITFAATSPTIAVTIVDKCPSDEKFKCEISSMSPYNEPTQIIICYVQKCDGEYNCPGGDDEDPKICGNCSADVFPCDQSKCISLDRVCDNIPDCRDGSDEDIIICEATGCSDQEMFCDGKCLSLMKTCDQINDCSNGEDEDPKYCIDKQCEGDEFRCRDGKCIDLLKRCNSERDCTDNDDEINCVPVGCLPDQHECGDGTCIVSTHKCDGTNDCQDRSDEVDCGCKGTEWLCQNNQCIPSDLVCNTIEDCLDGSDEGLHCNSIVGACVKDRWLCSSGECISESLLCDTNYDCDDGSDEANCTTCKPQDWQCNDGSCIQKNERCDNTYQCADHSDEIGCNGCNAGEWQCADRQCIPDTSYCDSIPDCNDGSDEHDCPIAPPTCLTPDNFLCDNRACIKAEKRCDGVTNCQDNSDELDCPPCSDDEFNCDNVICFPMNKTCDQFVDCQDGSDEYNCSSTPNSCSIDQFRCDDGVCLSMSITCNGYLDCSNGEDEKHCSCRADEFKCESGLCIPTNQICDGHIDCPSYGSDEVNCTNNGGTCSSTEFTCNSGECVALYKRCDQFPNCLDESDETGCPPVNRPCRDDEFTCIDDGLCIAKHWVCDTTPDCGDSSDEIGCTCTKEQFSCGDGRCISQSLLCDKQKDCPDGSDEDAKQCACTSADFKCDNGECIPSHLYCDSHPDCSDGSDETSCQREHDCEPTGFLCKSGECISLGAVCDGRSDCLDNSDEYNCPGNTTHRCSDGEFTCNDGICIGIYEKCNGRYDCTDGSDELHPDCKRTGHHQCSSNEFRCNDGNCVSSTVLCDDHPDCLDSSDEWNCPSTTTKIPDTCESDQFRCYSGGCIRESQRCDRFFDCDDQSDESNCPRCRVDEFTCYSGDCIGSNERCDGQFHCPDGSDEDDCHDHHDNVGCRFGEFQCLSGECIDESQKCDTHNDCRDHSDEDYCPKDLFTCYNGLRIDSSLKCNGVPDCHDGSDEHNCPGCTEEQFQCSTSKICIPLVKHCDGSFDCHDRSDEDCAAPRPPHPSPTEGLILRTYPDFQTIKQSREVVFQCRDEGPQRRAVRWIWGGGPHLPPGSSNVKGRLTIPNIQVEHSGTYICEAQVPPNTPGRRKTVTLTVVPYTQPTYSPIPECSTTQSTCRTGECIPKYAICDGDADCSDGSDEERCSNAIGCEPNEFQCNNKQCVGMAWICDADDDCGDGSDERNCPPVAPPEPGAAPSNCTQYEFSCDAVDQCIPRSFHCDSEKDCQDLSDEVGCSKPIVVEPPPRTIIVEIGFTFTITCRVIGIPTPIVIWRLNWGHVPQSCSMTSIKGFGELTCVDAQTSHQGAYSCEAINSLGSVFAVPDAIVTVNTLDIMCPPPRFNTGAIREVDCLTCFCFGNTNQCYSTQSFVTKLPPPTDNFQIIGVNQDQVQGNYVIRQDYRLTTNNYQILSISETVKLKVEDRTRLAGPRDLLIYFSLPQTHRGTHLTAYGGYLRYNVEFQAGFNQRHKTFNTGGRSTNRFLRGPDVIIRGNNMTLMHVHDYTFTVSQRNEIVVRFWPGQWYKKVTSRGGQIQSREQASRWDIMMALENIELLLIRASYIDSDFIDTTLSGVELDTTTDHETNQGRAIYVEECRCPTGYTGLSCQECTPEARRIPGGHHLGTCVIEKSCPVGQYGDPTNDIPCLNCPCPLTNRENQFSSTCHLDTDGRVTCDCQTGYEGRRCDLCANGYEGNPNIPGDSCTLIVSKCHADGSISLEEDPQTHQCQCKDYVTGRYCDTCQEGSFHLHSDNKYGCIRCFCMAITDTCSSTNWYRSQESVKFMNSMQGVQLVDESGLPIITNDLFTDDLKQELIFRGFENIPSKVYYWKLPQKFLGDKVQSYGGNLTYSLKYLPNAGGQRSRNNAYDVEILGNDVSLRYYRNEIIPAGEIVTINVPFFEHYWQRQGGQTVNREHYLMALADIQYIIIKATYTTGTGEVSLKDVTMSTASPRNTGTERAFAVEKCQCPQGYRGLSCEDCDIGFTREHSGLYLGTCEPCACNSYSDNCDPDTGTCFHCRNNRAGPHCDLCAEGYYERYGVCERIDPCSCDRRGSLSSHCTNNRCPCKSNVEGEECNSCREGSFFLSEYNRDGCLNCWCSGVTSRCSSSQYYREEIPMNLFADHGFTLTDRSRQNVISDGLDVSIRNTSISYSSFEKLIPHVTYYWSLPQIFTGNKLTSYGGKISITQSFESRSDSDIYSEADVIIKSSGNREFIWMNKNTLMPRQIQNYTVRLHESEFAFNQRPASREEFLSALSSIEVILIRAQLSQSMISTRLQYVTMDTVDEATSKPSGKPKAYEVEQCNCPREYIGISCEECAQGYYRDYISSRCNKCPCNGKEVSCIAERNGEVRCNCISGFIGPNCGRSEDSTSPTFVLEIHISQPNYEAEVGATIELICQVRVTNGVRATITWDKDGGRLPYGRASDNRQGILTIRHVRPEDGGTYICRASHLSRVAQNTTELRVIGSPTPVKPVVVIEETTRELRVVIGHYFHVRCRATGNPLPHLQWSRSDGRSLSSTISQQNGLLKFNSPTESDSGTYQCYGRNQVGIATATITIYVGPETNDTDTYIIVQVTDEEVIKFPGETVRVTCSVPNTNIRATLTWTRVQSELPKHSSQQNGQLIIRDATLEDSGLYTCTATDSTGRSGQSTTRIVIEQTTHRPAVRIEPDRQTINQGTSTELKCIASGLPTPQISWSKVNEELSRNVRIIGNVLRIENAVISDRGMYLCTAINDVGSSRASAIVEVERREPPVIEIYPVSHQIVEKGYSVMYQCHLTAGIPSPTIKWSRADGRPFTSNTEILSGAVLRFNSVTGDEEGSYVCLAVNDAGRVSATATLEIQAAPVIKLKPLSSPHRVQVGDRIVLECSAEGDPTPTVKWQKVQLNYIHELSGRSLSPSRSIYEIPSAQLSDFGTYQCDATNSVGNSIERIQILVESHATQFPENDKYEIPIGGNFSFRCFAINDYNNAHQSSLIYKFERTDGRPLPRYHTIINDTFSVNNTTRETAGEYACIVSEKISLRVISTIYATVEVTEPPSVRLEPPRQIVRPGDNVSLQCIVTGARPITITWSKEVGRMPSSVKIDGGQLSFIGIATTDTGRYICEAINSIAKATGIAEVIVNVARGVTEEDYAHYRDENDINEYDEGSGEKYRQSVAASETIQEKPLLTALQEHITITEGEHTQLRCEVTGFDPRIVRWSKIDDRLPSNSDSAGNVLRIYNAKPKDSGRYKCEARTPNLIYTYNIISLNVRSNRVVDIRIETSTNDVHIGGSVTLSCNVIGDLHAVVVWSKHDGALAYNAISRGSRLRITNVQPNNGGIYVCTATSSSGVIRKQYPLIIQNNGPDPYSDEPKQVNTRSVTLGSPITFDCGVYLPPPVSYTWSRQTGELPIRTVTKDNTIEIKDVRANDAGTYICKARNAERSVDVSTLLIVTGVIPRFSGDSYLALATLPNAYLEIDLEVSFKPEDRNGLIMYNSQRDGRGDFISFGLKDGFAEFIFDVGSKPAILKSENPLKMGEWHTVRFGRNRRDGIMVVDDGKPVTGKSIGRLQGLDLINPLYIGGVPDLNQLNNHTGFKSGFHGCISKFVIGTVVSDLMSDAKSQHQTSPCETCRDNPCSNGGSCLEAYLVKGHKCMCTAGFSGESCESTGESCYPGICGTGRCVNTENGLECFCPYGKTGTRCQHTIEIEKPAFARGAYMAYATPKALKRFSIALNIKPESLDDGIIMYCGQQKRGRGDFTSLTIKNKRLEFKFNTGTGTATLYSEEIKAGEWNSIHANRTDKMGSLQVNFGQLQNDNSPGDSRSLNLKTLLYIGGIDTSKIEVAHDVQVSQGFIGCISDIAIMEQQFISVANSVVESANVDQCGSSPCSRNPCDNRGVCLDDSQVHGGFVCQCSKGFSGRHCQVKGEGPCIQMKPCQNGGTCNRNSHGKNECLCPLLYTGEVCQEDSFLDDSVSFSKSSWIEMDRLLLHQDGISDQVVSITFSTLDNTGVLLWHGQEPSMINDMDKDYLTLKIVNGYLEFSFYMDREVVTAKSIERIDDGLIHTVTIKRSKNIAVLQLDNTNPVISQGSDSLFSFNTLGNIYLGGIPNQSGGSGFTGCIHGVTIGSVKISSFFDYALSGINVAPCSRGR